MTTFMFAGMILGAVVGIVVAHPNMNLPMYTGFTNEKLGNVNAEADGATGKAVLELTNLKENTDYAWYAVVTNTASDIEKSGVYEFTTAKKNESVNTGGSDSDNQENTNSDKLIGSIETGDRAKIWLFVLLGLSAAGIGAVTVIKKKEA